MGIFIGIGNYIGRKNTFLTNKDPSNIYYNLITEEGGNILTEMYNLILRDLNNIASEDSLIIISEDGRVIIRDEFVRPIASYRCYDKTNDDADRDVLTDLTGNGHDIQLYNFAWSGMSGVGGYGSDFSIPFKSAGTGEITQTNNKIEIHSWTPESVKLLAFQGNSWKISPGTKIRIHGLSNKYRLTLIASIDGTWNNLIYGTKSESPYVTEDGEYTTLEEIDTSIANTIQLKIYTIDGNVNTFKNIVIEQLPLYPNALVSDGVDDYGLCENFPILTKEKGYTVCAIRNHINNKGTLVSKRTTRSSEGGGDQIGAFQVERYYGEQPSAFSFGIITNLNSFSNDIFIFQKSNYYCNLPILVGRYKDYVDLTLFSYYKSSAVGSFALYALEIYDRDLTDEEIAKVKERMIAEYEEKTGNKYEEETT